MFDLKRVVKQQEGDVKVVSFHQFAEEAKKAGFNRFRPNLKPNNGGTPNIGFYNADGDGQLINLSKSVGKALAAGELKMKDLLGMQVLDGLNAEKQQRYYLANNQREEFDIDSVITAAKPLVKAKATLADISAMLEI